MPIGLASANRRNPCAAAENQPAALLNQARRRLRDPHNPQALSDGLQRKLKQRYSGGPARRPQTQQALASFLFLVCLLGAPKTHRIRPL